ncbi:hypothetical protein Cantr_07135 [Candida viswanathii]|uniref:F-box domain-containing protein n=1 Tax=Candida viswanathii TaxID=5486 RepID=A0A367Y1D4_9ASCO|nr:hypothetical protein Cantr_07135 [Candida viswanathii]
MLLEIFSHFKNDRKTLLSISLVCKKFSNIVNKYILYALIVFTNPKKFYQFANRHLLSDVSNKINYLHRIEFVNPQIKESANTKLMIAGTYDVESKVRSMDQLNYTDFIQSLSNLFINGFALQSVEFSEISPDFGFPLEFKSTSGNIFKRKVVKSKNRSLKKLILKTQSGWSIPFKNCHLSLIAEHFEVVEELHLVNFIIDHPITLKNLRVNKIVFDSCLYSFKKGVKRESLVFNNVEEIQLKKIHSSNELSLIDLVKLNNKNFHHLTLDIGSAVFYKKQEFLFGRYNPFFQLLCSGVGGYAKLDTLTLTDFDLFDCLRHDDVHEDTDSWIEPPSDNFETFMELISQIATLEIVLKKSPLKIKTCLNCGFKEQHLDKNIESLTCNEWKIFLTPLDLNNKNTIKILSHDYRLLYKNSAYD